MSDECIQPPASCANGSVEEADETCDDGNLDAGDGCSPLCQWEQHCFVAHLGGAGKVVPVRAYTIQPDGSIDAGGQVDLDGTHAPALAGLGSRLSDAAVSCGGRVYLGFAENGAIQGVELDGTNPVELPDLPDNLEGLRELACDDERGILFAARALGNDIWIDAFSTNPDGTLAFIDELEINDPFLLETRSLRMAVDGKNERLYFVFAEDGSSQIPVEYAVLSYSERTMDFVVPRVGIPTIFNDLFGLGIAGDVMVLTGVRQGGDLVSARARINADGTLENVATSSGSPWSDRHAYRPARLPSGAMGFVIGGSLGVIAGQLDVDDMLSQGAATIGPDLVDPFPRMAYNDTILVVASPESLQTFDFTELSERSEFTLRDSIGIAASETFQSGAIVPCPER